MKQEISISESDALIRLAHEWKNHDGGLWDLYIFNADRGTWRRVVEAIVASEFEAQLKAPHGSSEAITASIDSLGAEFRAEMTVRIGESGVLKSYFFTSDEVEFDIDPIELNAEGLRRLFDFARLTSIAADSPVYLCAESSPEYSFLVVTPNSCVAPVRPVDSTEFGRSICSAIVGAAGASGRGVADVAEFESRFRVLFQPHDIRWHTRLTRKEFAAIRRIDSALTNLYPVADESLIAQIENALEVLSS